LINDQLVDQWLADLPLPHDRPSGHTSTRRSVPGIALRADDVIRLEGASDGGEHAAVDFLEIVRVNP
jgi:hypothetical protein